ncbi:DUF2946 domain-containing protein [Pusillimonas sp.]|uniref:DUF2946 domain-containing protein n=1 Tax=Pusillimonas sp. TaxID=3040095 RepID=UPI0029A8E087|nr:DUF2946 domain-containing protein [Pusillimonas sp.]MDX3893725.1 DUF2946 domain-containing protein [Pusillimonas sp.]
MARFKARQPASWLVLIAVLFATLAPSLGMALGGHEASRTVWTELCSVDGPELVAIRVDSDPDSASTDDGNAHQGHCLLCFQPSSTPQLPSLALAASTTVVLRIAKAETTPARSWATWNIPLARAPPAIS